MYVPRLSAWCRQGLMSRKALTGTKSISRYYIDKKEFQEDMECACATWGNGSITSNDTDVSAVFHQLYHPAYNNNEDLYAMSEPLIDAHCHIQLLVRKLQTLYNCDQFCEDTVRITEPILSRANQQANISHVIVNGVSPCHQDWDIVGALFHAFPNTIVPNFGLHPWWIHEYLQRSESIDDIDMAVSNSFKMLEEYLSRMLAAHPGAGVGECGLDKNYITKHPQVTMDIQASFLQLHMSVAARYQRPITVHCVQAWGRLYDELTLFATQSNSVFPSAIILHSCNTCPVEMIPRFLSLPIPIYFSVSGRLLQEKQRNLLVNIPGERLLIETDSPDQLPASLDGSNIVRDSGLCTHGDNGLQLLQFNEPAVTRFILRTVWTMLESSKQLEKKIDMARKNQSNTRMMTLGEIFYAAESTLSVEKFAKLTRDNTIRAYGISLSNDPDAK